MKSPNRNLLVLRRNETMSELAFDNEVACLHFILGKIESIEQFVITNELVDRNKITSNFKKILNESNYVRLRPFRFLINKN